MVCEVPLRAILRLAEEDGQIGRRVAPRQLVAGPVEVHLGNQKFAASLQNISVSGTCVGVDFAPERCGDVTVTIGSLQLDATIVRQSKDRVGVRFDHNLSNKTFVALTGQFAPTVRTGLYQTPLMNLGELEIIISEFTGNFDKSA